MKKSTYVSIYLCAFFLLKSVEGNVGEQRHKNDKSKEFEMTSEASEEINDVMQSDRKLRFGFLESINNSINNDKETSSAITVKFSSVEAQEDAMPLRINPEPRIHHSPRNRHRERSHKTKKNKKGGKRKKSKSNKKHKGKKKKAKNYDDYYNGDDYYTLHNFFDDYYDIDDYYVDSHKHTIEHEHSPGDGNIHSHTVEHYHETEDEDHGDDDENNRGRGYFYGDGACPNAGSKGVPCAPDNLGEICDKYAIDNGSFRACLEACKPSFCCVHDAINNNRAVPCSDDENCPQYAYCYIAWWKLSDTIGPAPFLRVEQSEPFFDVSAAEIKSDQTGDPFYEELLFHHFDNLQTIIDRYTINGQFDLLVAFRDPQTWDI